METGAKTCVICGSDCAHKPRTKDQAGRYYCQSCYDHAIQARRQERAPRETTAPALTTPPDQYALEPQPAAQPIPPPVAALACIACGTVLHPLAHACPKCGTACPTFPPRAPVPIEPTEERATIWPVLVGTISIIVGALELAYSFCNTTLTIGDTGGRSDPDALGQVYGAMVAGLGVAGLAVWLIVCGIALARRRRWTWGWLIAWAATKATLALGCLGCGISALAVMGSQMTEELGPEFAGATGFLIVILLAVLIWSLLWPGFLIVWLLRPRIRAEMAGWP